MINKVIISKEAVFDYENIVVGVYLNKYKLKKDIEDLFLENDYKIRNVKELRLPYKDPSGKLLTLFMQRSYKFGKMRLWKLRGICETKDLEQVTKRQIEEWLSCEW